METLSADIVNFLRKEKKLTLKQIGQLMGGLSKSYISRIANGKRSLRIEHLLLLEESLEIPLPLIILRAREEESIPKEIRIFNQILKTAFQEFARSILPDTR